MGEMNEQDEGTAGGTFISSIPFTGLPLPIGLKAVPFLVGTGPTGTTELTECTFAVPDDSALRLSPTGYRVDIPTALVDAWASHVPQPLADSIAGFRNDLEEADRRQEQTVRVADHLAAIIEMALRCMGDKARAVEVIPDTGLSVGELMASAVAWWDQERDQERSK